MVPGMVAPHGAAPVLVLLELPRHGMLLSVEKWRLKNLTSQCHSSTSFNLCGLPSGKPGYLENPALNDVPSDLHSWLMFL